MVRFENKVVVVTGGSSGIGLATAQAFVAEGAKVVVTGSSAASVNAAQAALGETRALALVSDTTSLAAISTMLQETKAKFGGIDVLFVNAGVAVLAPFGSITEAQYDHVMNVNVKGAFFTAQSAIPYLNKGANIIFLSSVNAGTAMPNTSVYGPSKAALNAITKVLARELAPQGIRVNSVSPGPIETPLFGKVGLPPEAIQGFAGLIQAKLPLHRFGQAKEVASTVLHLASADASFVTGADWLIDGGTSLNDPFPVN